MATLRKGTTETAETEVVLIFAETKRDAQAAIVLAKTWLRANGHRFKLVFFHEVFGSQYSTLGRSYRARIAFRSAPGTAVGS